MSKVFVLFHDIAQVFVQFPGAVITVNQYILAHLVTRVSGIGEVVNILENFVERDQQPFD